ncbi:hypothetical protein AXG93_2964s1040 [Marchantia polymorpha subsp. ruderalis]|uniref:Uncharacterized protein n=1 Tax=Marchantia polymorpha subsp. ruderalis TaxID=1480154 RepID=A0A176VJU2_MARPO|nr:hypothetical protein AXG93_2964s1040 [Marchantia polymorpha subsp. ruderalis]
MTPGPIHRSSERARLELGLAVLTWPALPWPEARSRSGSQARAEAKPTASASTSTSTRPRLRHRHPPPASRKRHSSPTTLLRSSGARLACGSSLAGWLAAWLGPSLVRVLFITLRGAITSPASYCRARNREREGSGELEAVGSKQLESGIYAVRCGGGGGGWRWAWEQKGSLWLSVVDCIVTGCASAFESRAQKAFYIRSPSLADHGQLFLASSSSISSPAPPSAFFWSRRLSSLGIDLLCSGPMAHSSSGGSWSSSPLVS